MNTFDNIAAPATGIGGAITIFRLSGPDSLAIANRVWHGRAPLSAERPREMFLGKIGNDPALAVYMKRPASYTGDDVVELHCHGGAAAAAAALERILNAGCRMAEPGEFTFRAFVNGKLDLVQAEAVSDLISAGSDLALKSAERQLAGALSEKLEAIYTGLNDLRSECESRLDFPDEELAWDEEVPQKITRLEHAIARLQESAAIGASLRDGVNLVLAGKPNAGKSSLLNLLLGFERAIVTEIPGTTRDTVEAAASLRGIPVRLTDTAGLRESDDPIEQLGVERSRRTIAAAEITFWLLDATAADPAAEVAAMHEANAPHRIAVWNKIDAADRSRLPVLKEPHAAISARTGEGVEELLDQFATFLVHHNRPEVPEVAINARHSALLAEAAACLPEAVENFRRGEFELASFNLRDAATAIGDITGKTVEPDLLDTIFSRFCIGK